MRVLPGLYSQTDYLKTRPGRWNLINHLINILLNIRHSFFHSYTRHLSPVLFYTFTVLNSFFLFSFIQEPLQLFYFYPFTVHWSAVFIFFILHGPFIRFFRFIHSQSICLFVSFHTFKVHLAAVFIRGPSFSLFYSFKVQLLIDLDYSRSVYYLLKVVPSSTDHFSPVFV